MISYEEAKRILGDRARPLSTETVEWTGALGRVLAETVVADRDFPPTDRSAMDGFAVRACDLAEAGRVLRVVGEVRAGETAEAATVASREAMRVFTGAVVPEGADAVVRVEDTEEDREAGTVRVDLSARAGQHVRRRATDLALGATVLEKGTVLHAPEIAGLTSVGHTRPVVYRRPRVAVLSTGDEIVEVDATPEPHEVRNSNGHTLMAQLSELGIEGTYLGVAGDSPEELAGKLRQGLKQDVLLVSGGVSVGDYDFVGRVLEEAGMQLLFHRVAVKPGKPILVGSVAECLVFGLPGNPVSAFSGFMIFVAPVLRGMMGYRRWDNVPVAVTLGETLRNRRGRRTFRLGRVERGDSGLIGRAVQSTGSGDVLAMTRANAFLIVPPDRETIDAGEPLDALLWRDFQLR